MVVVGVGEWVGVGVNLKLATYIMLGSCGGAVVKTSMGSRLGRAGPAQGICLCSFPRFDTDGLEREAGADMVRPPKRLVSDISSSEFS